MAASLRNLLMLGLSTVTLLALASPAAANPGLECEPWCVLASSANDCEASCLEIQVVSASSCDAGCLTYVGVTECEPWCVLTAASQQDCEPWCLFVVPVPFPECEPWCLVPVSVMP
jgi:hypothetical protein